jgi:hypothetical protein
MAAADSGAKSLSPRVDLCNVGDGRARRNSSKARGREATGNHNMVEGESRTWTEK